MSCFHRTEHKLRMLHDWRMKFFGIGIGPKIECYQIEAI